MLAAEFDYYLPPELIAQSPVAPRDHSRLMVLDRARRSVSERPFYEITECLKPGDLVVWNNSKVFKARLFGGLVSAAGEPLFEHRRAVEIFLVRELQNPGVWRVLARPGRHVRPGTRVVFADNFYCDVLLKEPDGTILVQFPENSEAVRAKANLYGSVPLPPYVKDERHELEIYQTVYAKPEGSVAAPTAGFHFTAALVETLRRGGIEFAEVTLHIGLGTFLPVKTERVEDHTMHSEWLELSEESAQKVNRAKAEGRRVVAVGTTTVRTLETVARLGAGERPGHLLPYQGESSLFITPGFEFRIVDALITNFHLPKSTLLMLVSAFAGDSEFLLSCYRRAVAEKYRFYSFGDAMFLA